MKCRDLMKSEVECLFLNDTAQIAAERMRDMNVGFLPVCDRSMRVLGTLTDRDLVLRLVAEDLSATSTTIDGLLTPHVVACFPDDDIEDAERLMAARQKSRIVCVDEGGELLGVISLSDLAQVEDGVGAADTLRQVTGREARMS